MQEEGVEVRRHPLHLGGHLHHRLRGLPASTSLRAAPSHRGVVVREASASPSDPEDPGGSPPPSSSRRRESEPIAMTTGQQTSAQQAASSAQQPPSQHDSSSSSSSSSSTSSAQPQQAPPPPHYAVVQDQAQFEADKRAVYKHPLFPLLALLFERCEQATQSAECPNSENFNMDIQAFVQHQERDRKPFLVNDPEVDGLMIKAIQVLRIHLLELEKVQELCKDFCNRYITCLKGKMQSENLLRSDYAYENNNNGGGGGGGSNGTAGSGQGSTGGGSPEDLHHGNGYHQMHLASQHSLPPQNHQQHPLEAQQGIQAATGAPGQAGMLGQQPAHTHHHPHLGAQPGVVGVAAGPTAAAGYQMVQTPQGLVAQPVVVPVHLPGSGGSELSSGAPSAPPSPGLVHGSTPLSQIGANPCPPPSENSLLQGSLSPAPTTPGGSADDEEDFLGKKKQKRGVLPKHATSVMRSWLFQHLVHPYPTEDEKRQIAAQTNLTLLQVNNWFINARRRILQPMLDASNPEAAAAAHKAKKAKSIGGTVGAVGTGLGGGASGKQAAQRFWPENIANLQPQLGSGGLIGGAGGGPGGLLRGGAMGLSSGGEDESEEDEEEEGDAGGEEGDEEGGESSQDGEGPKVECCSNSGASGGDSPPQ
ncbi:homeobox protein PKNOX2-like [Ischnura elegans]|uniref:homeobox protein PKNOX2-like n=1 Tax=Ischnura elegans TaxID=197161 RepID=UPI001ED866BB|nr:homeobox protein PKNOX2-like [Ischnura elegans]XP_046383934.1 homeobox protein PKNOX2-like [Ischnura elegans]